MTPPHRLDVADADETTVNNELKIVRMFGRWLKKRAKLDDDPFEGVKDVVDDGEPAGRSLEDADFTGIVVAAKHELQRWLLVVGLHGLRKGEANHLRPQDINVEHGYLDICIHRDSKGKVTWTPKFRIERKVPFVENAMPLMKAVRNLPVDRHGHLMGVHDRRKALARAVLNAKVGGHVRFHDFRHTAYTKLKEALRDRYDSSLTPGDVQKIFGHKVQGMDRIYDHRTVERLRKVMRLMPLVDGVSEMAPVVGKTTAAVMVAALGDPRGYGSATAYLKSTGLNLKEKGSGKKKGALHITKRGPGIVRLYLYLAALRLLQRDRVVRAWYQEKVRRQGGLAKSKAVVAIMRKLVLALWSVAHGEVFDSSKMFDTRRLKISAAA